MSEFAPNRSVGSENDPEKQKFITRLAGYQGLLEELNSKRSLIFEGGGKKRQQREHERGKMLARERIAALVDADSEFQEIGTFVGEGMYEDEGGCPCGGTVMGTGHVSGKLCMIVANDATVKAGAWFPITAKKNLRAQEIALENRLPIIYLVDSAGVFLPMQDEIFPDKEHFGRIFRNNAKLSSMGIPQIAAVMGSCVAGGAYLPIMSDEALIVDGTGSIYLAGPFLVKAAIGEEVDSETLGGAATHSEVSGVTDYRLPDDATCLATIKDLVARMADSPRASFNRSAPTPPKYSAEELLGIMPVSGSEPYNMFDVLGRIIDADSWT